MFGPRVGFPTVDLLVAPMALREYPRPLDVDPSLRTCRILLTTEGVRHVWNWMSRRCHHLCFLGGLHPQVDCYDCPHSRGSGLQAFQSKKSPGSQVTYDNNSGSVTHTSFNSEYCLTPDRAHGNWFKSSTALGFTSKPVYASAQRKLVLEKPSKWSDSAKHAGRRPSPPSKPTLFPYTKKGR